MLIHLSSRPDNTTQHRSQTKPVQLQKEKTSTTHSLPGPTQRPSCWWSVAWLDGQEREQRICQNRSTDASASDWISKAELEDLAAARGSIRRARLDLSRGDEDSVNMPSSAPTSLVAVVARGFVPERHGSCVVCTLWVSSQEVAVALENSIAEFAPKPDNVRPKAWRWLFRYSVQCVSRSRRTPRRNGSSYTLCSFLRPRCMTG